MPPVIRALTLEDAEAFVALRRAALDRDPHAFSASVDDDDASSLARVRVTIERPNQAILGALDPHLIGTVGVYRDRSLKVAHRAWIWGMYVAPERRGNGVGRALLAAAVVFARALDGVTSVNLCVSSAAPGALALYERTGFVTWGTEPDALHVAGQSFVLHHMTLAL